MPEKRKFEQHAQAENVAEQMNESPPTKHAPATGKRPEDNPLIAILDDTRVEPTADAPGNAATGESPDNPAKPTERCTLRTTPDTTGLPSEREHEPLPLNDETRRKVVEDNMPVAFCSDFIRFAFRNTSIK